MEKIPIQIISGAYSGRSASQNPQECVNFFLEVDQEGGKTPIALYGTPGLEFWSQLYYGSSIRGMIVCDAQLYVVNGENVWKILTTGTTEWLGTISTSSGPVKMIENGLQVMIVDDYLGYVYTLGDDRVGQITDGNFPDLVRGLAYQDGYGIVTEKGTQSFFLSALYDFTSWDALEFASAEGSPDLAVNIIVDHRELWVFGEVSAEVFYNSGDAEFPFQRVQGAFLEVGCASPWGAAKLDNSVYWLSNYGTVVRASGYEPQRVSTHQIEYQWKNYNLSDAFVFAYHWQGHSFLQITFPTDGTTWVYDASNSHWHRRVSFPRSGDGTHGRHRADCYALFNNMHLVGDYQNGIIYKINDEVYDEMGERIHRWITTKIYNEKDYTLICHMLQVDFEPGVGLESGEGSNPQAMLQTSMDGGKRWSNEYWVPVGKMGEYGWKAIWRRLGSGNNRVVRISFTDPVKWVITGANASITRGIQ